MGVLKRIGLSLKSVDPKALGLMAVLMIAAADPVSAQTLDPIEAMLTTVKDALTGPIGVALLTIGLIGVGVACFFGRLPWVMFAGVFLGGVLILSADTIVGGFARSTAQ